VKQFLLAIAIVATNYYATTLAVWFGHWSSHRNWNPLRNCHVLGHHRLYPSSSNVLSDRFHYSSGKYDSLWTLIPPLSVELLVGYIALPLFEANIWSVATIFFALGTGWMHSQFHMRKSRLSCYGWFRKACQNHYLHHNDDVNYMVADHFWDRVFGSFRKAV
jgi:sterol desaturase/sphingolipid hydroxylase (fatty acid hydroxylase superfamily)